MYYLYQGLALGLSLSLLTGPILFLLLQTSLEEGFVPGIVLGSGIWMSDLLFILSVYMGLNYLTGVTNIPNFELMLGLIGGTILIAFGISTIERGAKLQRQPIAEREQFGSRPLWQHWMRGFAVNTFNPFTVLFWIGASTAVLANKEAGPADAWLFYGAVLGCIVGTDSLKVYLAQKIKRWLTPNHLLQVRKVSGAALVVFGVLLIARVLW